MRKSLKKPVFQGNYLLKIKKPLYSVLKMFEFTKILLLRQIFLDFNICNKINL